MWGGGGPPVARVLRSFCKDGDSDDGSDGATAAAKGLFFG